MTTIFVPPSPPGRRKFRAMERVWKENSSVKICFPSPDDRFQIDAWLEFVCDKPSTGVGSAILEYLAEHPALAAIRQIRIFKFGDVGVRVALMLRADVSRAVLYAALKADDSELIDHALINPSLSLKCLVWASERSRGPTKKKILAECARRAKP